MYNPYGMIMHADVYTNSKLYEEFQPIVNYIKP
jgi:hypothetical protein